MTQESHDHNFKNLFLDFPEEALKWILPEVPQEYGKIWKVEFPRQEMKKYKLSESALALDMPIIFYFESKKLLLWLVEFQEDKEKFSIYKLLSYTVKLMEAYPNTQVIPTVLFTDRKKWRLDVARSLENRFKDRLFLHFEYVFIKLFDFNAKDYYNTSNPLVKILLPKMNYKPKERWEVIKQAYIGLFELVSPVLFDKYTDFIDVYAEVGEQEREIIYQEITEEKETAMIAQYIRSKGVQEGVQQGIVRIFFCQAETLFGTLPQWAKEKIQTADTKLIEKWSISLLKAKSLEEVFD
ncbi:hypothetical protein GMMP13_420012 [Candidatus Magnetomoraceae bacterium gMMP-13]